MKKYFLIIMILLTICSSCKKKPGTGKLENNTITISGAWALYPMAIKWIEEYKKINPSVKIDITAGGAGKGISDTLSGIVDIGMVSRNLHEEEIKKGAYPITVTKDAVVATINKNNPLIEKIMAEGLTKDEFTKIWLTGEIKYWEDLFKNEKQKNQIFVYTRSDSCGAAMTWANYLDTTQENLIGVGVYSDPGLIESIRKDIHGIGYNNISYVYDINTYQLIDEIQVVPIDLNNNGEIEAEENFYNTKDKLIDAIKNNIFPSPPARYLYFITKNKPENPVLIDFISWVLQTGQQYLDDAGYIKLDNDTINKQLEKLD